MHRKCPGLRHSGALDTLPLQSFLAFCHTQGYLCPAEKFSDHRYIPRAPRGKEFSRASLFRNRPGLFRTVVFCRHFRRSGECMDVIVNGETETCAKNTSLADLLHQRGHTAKTVVTELNGQIVPHEARQTTLLREGDRLEIVHFVGGG